MNGSGQLASPSAARESDPARDAPVNRSAGVTGEALAAGPTIAEGTNGDRRIVSPSSAENANAEIEQQDGAGQARDEARITASED
jgi:hypothetical protein